MISLKNPPLAVAILALGTSITFLLGTDEHKSKKKD
jgi:hypothetical protein